MSGRNSNNNKPLKPQAGMNSETRQLSVLENILKVDNNLPKVSPPPVITDEVNPLTARADPFVKSTIFAELRDVSELSDEDLLEELQKRKSGKAAKLNEARDLIKRLDVLMAEIAE